MNVVIHTKIESKVMQDWSELWSRLPEANYANSPQWFLSVLEAFEYTDYRIITIYRDETLVAAGGLVKEKKFGVPVYTVSPGDFVSGIPFLVNGQDKILLKTFLMELLALGVVCLDNVPEQFVVDLRECISEIGSVRQTYNFYLPITKDGEGIVRIARRNKLLRSIRGFEDDFRLRSFDGTSDEGLSIVFALDRHSSKQGRGYSTFTSTATQDFYRSLAKHFQKEFVCNILYYKDMPIAYEIGFVVGKKYFGSQIAYNSEYAQYSPGKVLLVKLIDSLGVRNSETIDFGSGESSIKRLLTDEYRQLYQVILSRNSLLRKYIQTCNQSKNYLYTRLHHNAKLYSYYRNLRKYT